MGTFINGRTAETLDRSSTAGRSMGRDTKRIRKAREKKTTLLSWGENKAQPFSDWKIASEAANPDHRKKYNLKSAFRNKARDR